MSARTKLNGAYFIGCVVLAAIVGGLTQSWAVFFIALVVLILGSLMAGDIRPGRRN